MKNKRVKKLIRKYFIYWVHWTGLGYWSIKANFKKGITPSSHGDDLGGCCWVDWRYFKAEIDFYPQALRSCSQQEIENVVIHELMHILINEMRETGIDHEERVVTGLQKALSWVKGSK